MTALAESPVGYPLAERLARTTDQADQTARTKRADQPGKAPDHADQGADGPGPSTDTAPASDINAATVAAYRASLQEGSRCPSAS